MVLGKTAAAHPTFWFYVPFYAANGFWFEALAVAAELHQTNSADSTWAELLGAVGLENVVVVDEAIATP
jgi:Domain of Unknown Function (DUF928)